MLGSWTIDEQPRLTDEGVTTDLILDFVSPTAGLRVVMTPEQTLRLCADLLERATALLPDEVKL